VQWGRLPDVNTWYGYVNHHEVSSNADSGSNVVQITYVCLGTSAVLNADETLKWEQVSPTYIAKSIAASSGFRSVTSPNGQSVSYEVQVGESAFNFLCRMANKYGFRFWCSGGTLYMISPVVALKGSGSSAIPVFTTNKSLVVVDTCRNFQYMKGKNLPGSVQANRAIFGIDKSSGQLFTATTQPAQSTARVAITKTYATQSYADAKSRINAQTALAQFWIGATAQLYGTTELYPGKLIQLTGQALPDNAAGYWLVAKTTHNLSKALSGASAMDRYLVDVTLLSNTEPTSLTLSNSQPVSPEFVSMQLNQSGNWIATNLGAISVT
jgi:phage protein D